MDPCAHPWKGDTSRAAVGPYTGEHSREVVDLVVGVAEHLRLDSRSKNLAELTALLHEGNDDGRAEPGRRLSMQMSN